MSNELERFLETQDEAVSMAFLQNKGDALTDMLVAALEEAFELLLVESERDTLH